MSAARPALRLEAQTEKMSRAFVKEDGGERWESARPAAAYRAYLMAEGGAEVAHEDDSFAALLHWAAERERGAYEVRDAQGRRLAIIG